MKTQLHKAVALSALAALALRGVPVQAQNPLVTGKNITIPALGVQQPVGSLPMNMILSPNGKYAVTSDMGFRESIWAIRTSDGTGVSHVAFDRTAANPTNGLYYGLAFAPDGTLYASQGGNDSIAVLKLSDAGILTQTGTIAATKADFPAGLALDGRGYLYVANNDPATFLQPGSIAVYNTATGKQVGRYAFAESFFGTPNFPLAVATLADGSKTYVSSQRDGTVYVFDTTNPAAPMPVSVIQSGSHPVALLFDSRQNNLFIANAQSDTVSVVNTKTDTITRSILLRPDVARDLPGATPTGLGLSPDERTLYVTLGDMNAVAVVDWAGGTVLGYIPTGWYPSSVVAAPSGMLLVANAKGTFSRNPNPDYQTYTPALNPLAYDQNIIEGDVSTFAAPGTVALAGYTQQVLANNRLAERGTNPLAAISLQSGKIKHVIYIIKENRTYDQVLGDLPQGNGDPALTIFGRDVTPNQHALAERFVLLDNFYDSGEVSMDGWPWSTQGMANEYLIKDTPYNYSGRGRVNDSEGTNNGYITGGHPMVDPDGSLLSALFVPFGAPPIPDVGESPGGHIWDVAQRMGVSYRNYGFHYSFGVAFGPMTVVPDNYPTSAGLQPPGHDGKGVSDPDFRRYDNDYPDSDAPWLHYRATHDPNALYAITGYGDSNAPSRFSEWDREFQQMLAADPTGNTVPAFMTVRFNHDHTQGTTPGKHSPRSEVADNDYAVGQLVDALSKSPIWRNTAIFVIEDDSQDGPDHVDAHRSTALVISPYIKQSSVDHAFYNTVSILKSIELLLGLPPMSQNDAVATPVLDWDTSPKNDTPFTAILPAKNIIAEINPKLTAMKKGSEPYKLAVRSMKMDFSRPDQAPELELNEILWKSVKGPQSKMPAPRHTLLAGLKLAGRSTTPREPLRDGDD